MTIKVVRSIRKPVALAATFLVAATYLAVGAGPAEAGPVGLGTATSYGVLAGSAVTNTSTALDPTVVNGDLGVSPETSITGFPTGIVNGTVHSADAAALQAQHDLGLAYDDAAGRGPATSVATELGGTTLGPGVHVGQTLGLTGTVTLDAQGDADAVFLIRSNETLVTAEDSAVSLIGEANPCNVYWLVGSSATFGVDTDFVGTTMAMVSITATTGADFEGRLLARTGAVTLDTNTITRPTCDTLPAGSTTTAPTTTTAPPTSSTTAGPTTTTAPPTSSTTAAPTTTTTQSSTTTTQAPATTSTSIVLGTTTTNAPSGSTTTAPATTTTSTSPATTSTTSAGTTTTSLPGTTSTTAAPTATTGPAAVTSTTAVQATTTEAPATSSTTAATSTTETTGANSTTTGIDLTLTEASTASSSTTTTGTTGTGTATTELARTGSDTERWAVIGALTIGAGASLIVASRRRASRTS